MVKNRAAMVLRLRALRKKHGLGEFKNKVRKTARRAYSMAKKKRFGSKSSSGGMLKNVAAGVGAAVVVRQFGGASLGNLTPLATLGASYYTGGMAGLLGAVVTGQASLGGILGNGGSSSTGGW